MATIDEQHEAYQIVRNAIDGMGYTAPEILPSKALDLVLVTANYAKTLGVDPEAIAAAVRIRLNPFARAPEDMHPHRCVHAYDICVNEGCLGELPECDEGGCKRAKAVLRREGYMLALERVKADLDRFGNSDITQSTLRRVLRTAYLSAPGEDS